MKFILILFLIFGINVYSQQNASNFRIITGKIIDAYGEPLLGQPVYIQGFENQTVVNTNFDGRFSLVVPKNFDCYIMLSGFYEPLIYQISTDNSFFEIKLSEKRTFRRFKRKFNRNYKKYRLKMNALYKDINYSEVYKYLSNLTNERL